MAIPTELVAEKRVQVEQRLKALVRERGISQIQLAARMDISPAQVTRLFKGQREWRPRYKRLFCMAAGISMEKLDEALNGA